MRPFNIFSQSALLFLLGSILLLRSHVSKPTDKMLGGTLIIFSLIRLLEFISIKSSNEESARAIATIIWFLPLTIMICCFLENKRLDTLSVLLVVIAGLIYYFAVNISIFSDHYTLISPNRLPGDTNGLFSWLHFNSNGDVTPLFLPFAFYLLLTVSVMYMISTFVSSNTFWILFSSIIVSSVIGSVVVSILYSHLSTYFWSMFSFVLIVTGTLSILLFPG